MPLIDSVRGDEPVDVVLSIEHCLSDFGIGELSVGSEALEELHSDAEVCLSFLVGEPYLFDGCDCRLLHNLSCFKWFMLWRQYRRLPALDVPEFVRSFAYEVLYVRVGVPKEGASDGSYSDSAVFCQLYLASSSKFYWFSLCHVDLFRYICILNI